MNLRGAGLSQLFSIQLLPDGHFLGNAGPVNFPWGISCVYLALVWTLKALIGIFQGAG